MAPRSKVPRLKGLRTYRIARQTGEDVRRAAGTRTRAGALLTATLLTGLIGAESANGITVSRPDMEATVTASVAPTRLPARGGAPVTLTVEGSINRPDDTVPSPLHAISLLLDHQLTVTTTGLAICTTKLALAPAAYARKHCGQAQIGSGTVDETLIFPEGSGIPPSERHAGVLFFNSRQGVLMFTYLLHPGPGEVRSSVVSIGSGRRLRIRMGPALGSTASFRFRFGRIWHDGGERRSYLSGRCATGTLRTKITLSFTDGEVSEAEPQGCTRRG